jgi:hypothetical protein
MKKLLMILLITFLSRGCSATCNEANYIVVHGSTFTLELYDQYDHVIKSYSVGLGKNGMGKTKRGDKKTPLGEYHIIWKASRFAETDGGYEIKEDRAFCGPESIFTADPRIGFDDEQLWTAGYGGDQAVVMGLDYPNELDRARGYVGECIEIHASLLGGIGKFASAGCVRMKPDDARDLYQYVAVGTLVIIQEQ